MSARAALRTRIPPELAGVKIPRHIAIIMDGNGRWAVQKGQHRIFGHEQGARTVDLITEECARLGVGQLTLYAFSSENWKRPAEEVEALMHLLESYLVDKRKKIMENNIVFRAVGRLGDLPEACRVELEKTTAQSAKNTGMTLCLALNYGGRVEIIDAARRFAEDVAAGRRKPDELTEELLSTFMYDPKMPGPDLLVRTAGEMRISNFLLWHISYSEFYVTPVLWPDFGVPELYQAIKDYTRRDRRFGGLSDLE